MSEKNNTNNNENVNFEVLCILPDVEMSKEKPGCFNTRGYFKTSLINGLIEFFKINQIKFMLEITELEMKKAKKKKSCLIIHCDVLSLEKYRDLAIKEVNGLLDLSTMN